MSWGSNQAPINLVAEPRFKAAVLNVVETSQRPFFEHLGTPADRKKWTVYEGGHDVPRTELIVESLRWLDTCLGPVR